MFEEFMLSVNEWVVNVNSSVLQWWCPYGKQLLRNVSDLFKKSTFL